MAISNTIESMYNNVDSAYTSLANKGATIPTDKNLANLADTIDSIPAGGSGGEDVIFYDYDGTVVQSYSKDDFLALTAMPENPTHTGLVAQGWNWSLSDAKTYVTSYGKLNVGQMYKTASGLTEFDIELTPVTGLTITFQMDGTTNWGDGTSSTTTSGSSHTYADYGKYTITCNGQLSTYIFGRNSPTASCCSNVRLGENCRYINGNSFNGCNNLQAITMPNSLLMIDGDAFAFTFLKYITIPNSLSGEQYEGLDASCFRYSYNLRTISFSNETERIGQDCFTTLQSLTGILTLPDSVVSIGVRAFKDCRNIRSIIFGKNIRSLGTDAFTGCYSVTLYDFSAATNVPSIQSTSFGSSLNNLCKIIVPDSLYSTWITTSNWTAYANYIYKASEV